MQYPASLLDDKNDSDVLIVAFSGHAFKFGMIPVFEFYNFLNKHYPKYNKHFYIDTKLKHFHYGIQQISDSVETVETTVYYLRDKIKKYNKVVFMGVSSGGYAAILFGSLLNVTHVIAFIPQTILFGPNLDDKYRDLKLYINNITKYYLYGDPNIQNKLDCHHIFHCERLCEFPNVIITPVPDCTEMSKIKQSGQLFDIISGVLGDL